MSNKAYDILRYIAQMILPAAGTLYFALAEIWEFTHVQEIMGTVAAVDTFLGTILHLSHIKYCKDCEKKA